MVFQKIILLVGATASLFSVPVVSLASGAQFASELPFLNNNQNILDSSEVTADDNAVQQSTLATSTTMQYDAWIYPDAPGALDQLVKIGRVHVVRAEFLHVNEDGTLRQINQDGAHPNGYSPDVIHTIAAHSDQRYITVSGTPEGTALAMQNPETISKMVDFANEIHFGIELDWEDFGSWTPEYYQQYKSFVQKLANTLHNNRHYIILDGPPICDADSQAWYQWKYEDLAPLANYITMMIYDNQYDTGAGGSIAPRDWSQSCLNWLKDKAGGKGIPGLAAYGYKADESTGRISVNTSSFVSNLLQQQLAINVLSLFATRNADGEMTQTVNGTFYDYSDKTTMQMRVSQAQNAGFDRVSIWSLGGNPWP